MDYRYDFLISGRSCNWSRYFEAKSKSGQMKDPVLINNVIHSCSAFERTLLLRINKETWLSHLNTIKNILTSKMGNMWDFYVDVSNTEVGVEMLFPKITIHNSEGRTHELLDLVVSFYFEVNDYGQLIFSQPRGLRLTRTSEEIAANYSHSHLPTSTFSMPSLFCIGVGTEIDEFLTSLHFREYTFSDIAIETYLYAIDSLITYESIESNPFIAMSNIGGVSSKFFHDSIFEPERYILNIFKSNIGEFNHDYKEGKVEIRKDRQLINFLLDNLPKEEILKHRYVIRQGLRYTITTLTTGEYENIFTYAGKAYTHYFDGKPFKMSVITKAGTEIDKNNIYLSEKFLDVYINILKQEFYENEVKKSAVARATTNNNA